MPIVCRHPARARVAGEHLSGREMRAFGVRVNGNKDLRLRLVGAFSALALVVLAIFAVVLYSVARDSGLKHEYAALHDVLGMEADALSAVVADPHPVEAVLEFLQERAGSEYLPLAVRDDGRILAAPMVAETLGIDSAVSRWSELVTSEAQDGALWRAGQRFNWSRRAIPKSNYQLVVLRRSAADGLSLLDLIGVRVLLVGLAIGWLAVWLALIVSAAIIRRYVQDNARRMAVMSRDALTGLPNRLELHQALQQEPEREAGALMVMDLDQFKEINDTLGHNHGDALLKEIGPRLRRVVRDSDLIVRLGGDEFAVVLRSVDEYQAVRRAHLILESIAEPFLVEGIPITVDTSIGIARFPADGVDAPALVRAAEVAMYHAKAQHSGYAVYTKEFDPYNRRRLSLLGDLRLAIERGQMSLYFQAEVDIRARRVWGVEALLRWQHPQHGFVPPDEFIPLAEQAGIINPLTIWVLNAALRQWRTWKAMGIDMKMAVNISVKSFQDDNLAKRIGGLLKDWEVPPDRLELEITESIIMEEPERAMRILTELNHMGVGLAIDDFGTGHSSLAYIKKLPVARIKIDKSFVLDMIDDDQDAIIVRTIVELAHNLGLDVTAEGVETLHAWELLEILGCDLAQGYYLFRPMPADDLIRALLESPYHVVPSLDALSRASDPVRPRDPVVTPWRPRSRS